MRTIEEYEKQIPVGIVACTPGDRALVKLERGIYTMVLLDRNEAGPCGLPYNMALHGMTYMKENNIVVSEAEKQKIMSLVNANKETIYSYYKNR